MSPRFFFHVLVTLFLLPWPIHARPITVEDLWKVKRLGKPAISPDGKWVAVEVTTFSMEENNSTSDIWLLATDGKTQKQLTTYKGKNTGPVWSPDGKTIAFLSKRSGDVPQIFLISPDGGEARQLTHMPMAPTGLKWGPDGKTIYCIASTWPDTPDDDSYQKKDKAKKDDKVQAYIIDDALYRYWDHWLADGKRPVIFAVDTGTGKHQNLFTHTKLHLPVTDADASAYDISPDGKELCFTADSTKDPGTDFNLDLYTMSLETNTSRERQRAEHAPKNITTDNPGNDFNPAYSPDGKWMAFLRQTTKFFYADRARIMNFDRKTGKTIELSGDLDRSCSGILWDWDLKGLGLFFEVEDEGRHRIASYNFGNRLVTFLTDGFSDTGAEFSRKRDGLERFVFLRSTFDFPVGVYCNVFPHELEFGRMIPLKTTPWTRPITHFNNDLVKQWDLGPVKNITFQGADDENVQMWLIYPPGFDAKKKWPLLMVVHGGPHNAITNDFHFRWNAHLFASKGYVVAIPNFHGSSGFGQKYTDSITGDMATKPFIDIMKATDYLEKEPYIDKERMAAAGASYGGYMMAWMNGHTDRFKAMICHAGVYNWHTQMASDIVRSRERALGALPWGDIAKIDKQSPQRFSANFKTPTLIFHGEKDYRVPINNGLEYYNTLRLKGVPTRLVYFLDENHWVLKPQNSRLWHREFFAWLEKYIGRGPSK